MLAQVLALRTIYSKIEDYSSSSSGLHRICPIYAKVRPASAPFYKRVAEILMFLSELPYAQVIGTEIAVDCEELFAKTMISYKRDFPRIPLAHGGSCVQWDMQNANDAWNNRFDIVYSNSFDHSIYPEETLKLWRAQCNTGGSVFIEYSEEQSIANADDPLGASFLEVKTMMEAVFQNVTILGVSGKSGSRLLRGDK